MPREDRRKWRLWITRGRRTAGRPGTARKGRDYIFRATVTTVIAAVAMTMQTMLLTTAEVVAAWSR